MPDALIPFIPLIAAGIGSGTSLGLALSNQPSSPTSTQPTPAQITQNAVQSATQQRQAQAVDASQLLPNLQYDTGGGLSPDAYSNFSSTFSGNAGIANSPQLAQLVSQFLGLNSNGYGSSTPYGSTATGLAG